MTSINGKHPFVSLLLPIRNEGQFIPQSLGTVFWQDYPFDRLEIIVADGLSTDGTYDVVQAFQAKHPNLKLIDNPGQIVPTGLNAAIACARGEIIIRVDGHTNIAPDYVRQCVAELQRTSADNVGGKMNATGQGPWGQAIALATSSPFGVGGARFHYSNQEEWVDTVYMGAWRREVFNRIGLFDEELVRNQDDEFNYRLRASGGKILLSPLIKSTYTVRSTLPALWRQYFQYGFWKVRVLQKHPSQMQPRQFVPPLFAASLAGAALLSPFTWVGQWVLGLVLAVYLAANLLASLYSAHKSGWRYLPLLPVVFATLHLGYGFGFLAGLVKFWNRWGDKVGKVPAWPIVDA